MKMWILAAAAAVIGFAVGAGGMYVAAGSYMQSLQEEMPGQLTEVVMPVVEDTARTSYEAGYRAGADAARADAEAVVEDVRKKSYSEGFTKGVDAAQAAAAPVAENLIRESYTRGWQEGAEALRQEAVRLTERMVREAYVAGYRAGAGI